MRIRFLSFLAITLLSTLLILSGCGSSKTSSTTSTTGANPTREQTATAQTDSNQPNADPLSTDQATTDKASELVEFKGADTVVASWVDAKSDVLGPSEAKSDGIMDGHFHLALQLPQPVLLESIFIRYSEYGKELRWDGMFNNRLTPAGYNLSVYEKGALIPPVPDKGLIKSGQVDLDLFAAGLDNARGRDTFSFKPADHFEIEVNYITQTGEHKKWSTKITAQ